MTLIHAQPQMATPQQKDRECKPQQELTDTISSQLLYGTKPDTVHHILLNCLSCNLAPSHTLHQFNLNQLSLFLCIIKCYDDL